MLEVTKRSQHFIGTHNETPPIIALCVHNPDRSLVEVESELANLPCFPANSLDGGRK
jgi:hypothetical protein